MADLTIYVGIAADVLTFAGSFLLAKEAVLRVRDLEDLANFTRAVQRLNELVGPPTVTGQKIASDQDAEFYALRKSVKTARTGVVVVAIGFLLQLAVRVIDAISKPA
jgi:hypothetical protein